MSSNKIVIYTDGSAIGNGKEGGNYGGAAVFIYNSRNLVGKCMRGTNNICELEAIRYIVNLLLKNSEKFRSIFNTNVVEINSDSLYAIKAVTGINKAKVNVELIESIMKMLAELRNRCAFVVEFNHVKAHTKGTDLKSICNAIVDRVAQECSQIVHDGGDVSKWHKVQLKQDEIDKLDRFSKNK